MSVPHSHTDAFAIPELKSKYLEDPLIKVRILSHTVFACFLPQNHLLLKSVTAHTNKMFSDLPDTDASYFSVNTPSRVF